MSRLACPGVDDCQFRGNGMMRLNSEQGAVRAYYVGFGVLVDDGSPEAVADHLSWPEIRCHRLDENHGPAYAVNRGIEETSSDWVMVLNSDVEVTPESLHCLFEALAERPGYDFAVAKLLHAKEPPTAAGPSLPLRPQCRCLSPRRSHLQKPRRERDLPPHYAQSNLGSGEELPRRRSAPRPAPPAVFSFAVGRADGFSRPGRPVPAGRLGSLARAAAHARQTPPDSAQPQDLLRAILEAAQGIRAADRRLATRPAPGRALLTALPLFRLVWVARVATNRHPRQVV